jgi:hypothetical protein
MSFGLPLLAMAFAGSSHAGQATSPPPAAGAGGTPSVAVIEDNSFFIEEAYNQEERVVQHISGLWYDRASRTTAYGFTQEWPLGGQRHQLSYSLGYNWEQGARSVGDVLVNYRYQLTDKSGWAAMSPRVSLLWPEAGDGSGRGALGLQVNLPVSKRVGDALVLHGNAGATLNRRVEVEGTARRTDLWANSLGLSAIWLLRPELNLMLEAILNVEEEAEGPDSTARRSEILISPGVRRAWNVGSLQIVPGLAVPIRVSGSPRGAGVFVYLSLEHPFGQHD